MDTVPKIFVAIPLLREFENIENLVSDILQQDYPEYYVYACVNNPREWYDMPEKKEQIANNIKTIEYLNALNNTKFKVFDKVTQEKAFPLKKSGVGHARKLLMDAIVEIADDNDIIICLDGDTSFNKGYFSAVATRFSQYPNADAIAVPYYHPLNDNEELDMAMLRYELYMRHYLIQMMRIENPYAFAALGSAIALKVATYKKVGGIAPKQSGEDFYLMQNIRKSGRILLWCDEHVYPQGRLSDRVGFGTGPALLKGLQGDWKSYPIYAPEIFDEVKESYETFQHIYEKDIEIPMTMFLKNQFKTNDLWNSIRKNFKTKENFVHACMVKVDALRILQYVRFRHSFVSGYKYKGNLKQIREQLYQQENEMRKQFDKNKVSNNFDVN